MKAGWFLLGFLLFLGCSRSTKDQSPAAAAPTPPVVDTASLDPFLSQTISNAQAAAKNASASPEAWGRLGEALHAAEFSREASICYARANQLDPNSARWLYLLAITQIQDNPAQGLSNMHRAVQMTPPTNDAPRLRLAQALIEHGRNNEALPLLDSMLAANPNHFGARVELARIKLAANDTTPIEDLLRPALTNAYTARAAHLLLSQSKQRAGEHSLAETLSRRAASLPRPPDWPDPFLRDVKALLAASQQNLSDRANALLIQGRSDDAEKLLNQLIQRSPDNPEPLLLLGRLRIQQRRCAEAEGILLRHLALRSNSLQGWMQLGLARFCDSRWADAAVAFRAATEIKPDFAQAHYNLGIALTRDGKSAEAIRAFEQALRADPADANTHAALAEEFLRIGNITNARNHAEAALRLDPKHSKALKIVSQSR